MNDAISATRRERRKLTDAQLYANEQLRDCGNSQLGADLDSEGGKGRNACCFKDPLFGHFSCFSRCHTGDCSDAMCVTRATTGDFIAFGESAR